MCTGPHPFIPVPGVLQVEMRYTHLGEKVENVFHITGGIPWDVANINLALDVFEQWNAGSNLALQSNQTILTNIRAFDLTTETGTVVDREITVNNVGNIANIAEPGVVTVAIKKASNTRGRGSQGRFFWIGIPEQAVEGNQITSAIRGGLIQAANTLLTNLTAEGFTLVVVSLCQNNVWRTTGTTTAVTGFSVDTAVDSQVRRGAGRGR